MSEAITPVKLTKETLPKFLDNLKNEVYMVVWEKKFHHGSEDYYESPDFYVRVCTMNYPERFNWIHFGTMSFFNDQKERFLKEGVEFWGRFIHSFLEVEKPIT